MERNEAVLREAASRMARQLVQVVEPVLYGWELEDCAEEFEEILLVGLKELTDERPLPGSNGSHRELRA